MATIQFQNSKQAGKPSDNWYIWNMAGFANGFDGAIVSILIVIVLVVGIFLFRKTSEPIVQVGAPTKRKGPLAAQRRQEGERHAEREAERVLNDGDRRWYGSNP